MKVIERSFGYWQDNPVMILRPAGRDNHKRFIIRLGDLWKYSDTHNEHFESFIINKIVQISRLLDITVPRGERSFAQMMSSISSVIMDGIDDLVKMPPYRSGIDDPTVIVDSRWSEAEKNISPDIQVRMM